MDSRVARFIRAFVSMAVLAFVALLVVSALPAQAHADAEGDNLAAPNLAQPSSDLGGVYLSWNLDYEDSGDNPLSPDEGLIDHFNVYCDGRLVAQVDISAVEEEVWSNDNSRHHTWELRYDPGDRWTPHNFQVSSVAKDGTEGCLCDAQTAHAASEDAGFGRQESWYTTVWDEELQADVPCVSLDIYGFSYSGFSSLDIWRSDDGTPPDTSAEPFMQGSGATHQGDYSYRFTVEDTTNVSENRAYTYTVRFVGTEGQTSNFYTFTVKTIPDMGNAAFSTPDVTYEVVNNTTPTLSFRSYKWDGYTTTYRFYRNDAQIDSFTGTGSSHSFSDTPTADGTYTYRVDREVAGITSRGREYTFTRDTTPIDPNTLPSKPDAPTLAGRLDSKSVVTLGWTPAATGGEVEGYHIYRKDAGEFVEGSHRRSYESSGTFYAWGMNRYLDVPADTNGFADAGIPGATDAYLGDYNLGRLTSVWWSDSDAPHEYYVTAYNQYGESAPSNVITFPYADGSAPENGDTTAPGAPTIRKAWVEWDDGSNDDSNVEQGAFDEGPGYTIHVAWDEPADAAMTVSSYRATFVSGEDYNEDSVARYGLLNGLRVQDGTSEYSPEYKVSSGGESKYNKEFTVTMYAENEAGSTASESVTVRIDSPPRIQVANDNGTAVVHWAAPAFSLATVTGWELYKRPEHGLATKVGDFGSDVHGYTDKDVLDGWSYEYRVVAKTDAGDRTSVWASRLITADTPSGVPGAPTNLTASVINGRVVLSWTRPEYEGYVSWYMAEFKFPGSDKWVTDPYEIAYYWSEGMTIENVGVFVDKEVQVRVWAENSEGEGPRSNEATIAITSAQAAGYDGGAPGTVNPSGEAGDGWCKVTWSTSTDTSKPPATEYRIMRYDTADGIYGGYSLIGIVPAKGEGSYDYEYVDRTAENGRSYRYMVYPTNFNEQANPDANYNYVALSPSGKTYDQVVAEQVATIIASLPEPDDVTADDVGLIREVEEIWNGLTSDQQRLVKEVDRTLPGKLADDVAAADELEQLERYRELAAQVQGQIDALPDAADVTLADKTRVEAARAAYDAITYPGAKKLVDTARLVDAEARIAALEKEAADEAAAASVRAMLEALPAVRDLKLSDKDDVAAARAAFDALTADQQALISDEQKQRLSDAEARIAELQEAADQEAADGVIALIDRLPEPGSELTEAQMDDVDRASEAYDALTAAQKGLVGDAAREKLAALGKQAADARRVDIASGEVTLAKSAFTYDGKAKEPEVTLAVGGKTLELGTDFTVEYTGNVGAGTARVTLAGTGAYKGTKTTTFTIDKAANTLSAKGKTATVKYAKVKKKKKTTLKPGKAFKFASKGQGTLTYAKKKGSKKIAIDKKTGKVTVKKGLKKGTYKVKAIITAAGDANHKAATVPVTFKVKVK